MNPRAFRFPYDADQADGTAQPCERAGRDRSATAKFQRIILRERLLAWLRPIHEAGQDVIHVNFSNYYQVEFLHGVANGHSRSNLDLIR